MLKSILLSTLLIIGQVAASFYPCPSPPAENQKVMSLSEAYSTHLQYPQGWYFATGTLCEIGTDFPETGCDSPVGYQLTTSMYNLSQIGSNAIVSPSTIALTDNSGRYQWTNQGTTSFPKTVNHFDLDFDAPSYSASISYKNVGFLPAGTLESSYIFSASTSNVSINLFLISLSPTMWQGTGGYTGFPNSTTCTGFYYVSMPQLYTFGTVTLNGQTKFVSGETWFDHQWGGALPGSGTGGKKSGWDWLGLRFGSLSMLVLVLRQNGVYLIGDDSMVDVQHENGNMEYGKVLTIEVLDTWTSSIGVTYPVYLSINTTVPGFEQLLTFPVFLDQEVGSGKSHYWEGFVQVEATSRSGNGYLELTGFQQ